MPILTLQDQAHRCHRGTVALVGTGLACWYYGSSYGAGAQVQLRWDAENSTSTTQSAALSAQAKSPRRRCRRTTNTELETKNAAIECSTTDNAACLTGCASAPHVLSSGLPSAAGPAAGCTGASLWSQIQSFLQGISPKPTSYDLTSSSARLSTAKPAKP